MTSARRKAGRTYHGLVGGKRLRGNVYTGGGARRMAVKTVGGGSTTSTLGPGPVLMEPHTKPNGKWGYRFRHLKVR